MSYLHPALYVFAHDDGHIQSLHGDIHVAQPTLTNHDLPSLLGWDILRYFRIELDYVGLSVTLR